MLTKERFELKKKETIQKGDSVDDIIVYMYNTFENIMKTYSDKNITINMYRENDVELCFNVRFTYNNSEYIFCGKNMDDNEKYLNINKCEICDIIIDNDEFEKRIILLLAEDEEVIIDIE